MIPYPYNMVDMGGIDLAEANGTVVEGLYDKIVEAVNACGDVVLYNWKFASIGIAPQHTQILLGVGTLTINTLIQVTEQDVVTVLGIEPSPPEIPVEPLNVYENGVYNAVPPMSGFNPVNVAVPAKVLVPLVVTENGTYDPADYQADGFSSVEVDVETPATARKASRIATISTGGGDASVSVQEGTYNGFIFTPTGEAVNVLYTEVRTNPRVFDLVSLAYPSGWILRAVVPVVSNGILYNTGGTISTWPYYQAVDFIVVEST